MRQNLSLNKYVNIVCIFFMIIMKRKNNLIVYPGEEKRYKACIVIWYGEPYLSNQ